MLGELKMVCDFCLGRVQESAKFCPSCGLNLSEGKNRNEGVVMAEDAHQKITEASSESWMAKNKKLSLGLGAVAAGFLMIILLGTSGGGGSVGPSNQSNPIEVERFGCSYGTEVASAIVRNNGSEGVNAFVTVGLYGSEGTLQWSGTEWGYVEPGGTSLINVRLGGYIYLVGECKIINAAY